MREIYLGCSLLTFCIPAFAEEQTQNNHPVHQMNKIMVTATAKEQNIHDVIASADVVDGQQLRQRYVNDLSDALDDRVGVQQVGVGLNRKGISIRGMNSEHTLFLVDGQRINSSSSAIKHSDGELNWVPVEAIEQIEVVRGPLSSLYGSEALGGVVNVITRKPTKAWTGSFSTQGVFNETGLGGDQYKSSAYLAGPLIQDKLGINIWGEYRHRDFMYSPFDKHLTDQEKQKNGKGHIGLFWQPTTQQAIDFTVEHGVEDRKDLRAARTGYYQVDDEFKRTRYGVKHQGDWSWGKSTVQLYRSELRRENDRSDRRGETSSLRMTDDVASTQFQFDTGSHSWTVGNELRREELKDPTVNKKHKARQNHYGLYLQDQWALNDRAKFILGARGDYHDDFGWELSPKFSSLIELNDHFSLRGGISKGYKAPSLKQLSPEYESNEAMGGMGIIYGNTDLTPETNTSYELGLHFHQGDLESSVTWFQNDVDDLIDTIRRPTCGVRGKICLGYVNISKAKIQGVEWSASYQIEPNWHFNANYTYLDAKNETSNEPLMGRSKHQVNTSVIWQITDKFQAKLRQQYLSKQYQDKKSPYDPSYTLWHLYTDYQVNSNLSFNAGIENIGDERLARETAGTYTLADAGRRYFVGLNLRF
nr:TonB-dependent receptor [Acinetobacter sp. Marseille-Q1620]